MSLSTHVLDAVSGRPAAGVPVTLLDAHDAVLHDATTDDDGRVASLADHLAAGRVPAALRHRSYFAAQRITGFYPEIVIAFEVTDATAKYHVPVLLSPYAYSTYRGS